MAAGDRCNPDPDAARCHLRRHGRERLALGYSGLILALHVGYLVVGSILITIGAQFGVSYAVGAIVLTNYLLTPIFLWKVRHLCCAERPPAVPGARRAIYQSAERRRPAPGRASGPGANEKVITVGRVSPEKGLLVLLEAWAQVHAARPGAELQIVGPVAVCPRELLVDLSTDPEIQALSRFYPGKGGAHRPYGETLRAMVSEELTATVRFVGPEPHESVLLRFREAAVREANAISFRNLSSPHRGSGPTLNEPRKDQPLIKTII